MSCRKDVPVSVEAVDWVQQGAECCGGVGHNGNIPPRANFMALHKDLRPILAEFGLVLIFTGSTKVKKEKSAIMRAKHSGIIKYSSVQVNRVRPA